MRKSKKDRKHNGQNKRDTKTNNNICFLKIVDILCNFCYEINVEMEILMAILSDSVRDTWSDVCSFREIKFFSLIDRSFVRIVM
jgi:hypothetical protein